MNSHQNRLYIRMGMDHGNGKTKAQQRFEKKTLKLQNSPQGADGLIPSMKDQRIVVFAGDHNYGHPFKCQTRRRE